MGLYAAQLLGPGEEFLCLDLTAQILQCLSLIVVGPIVHGRQLYDLVEALYRLIEPSQVVKGRAFALPGHYTLGILLDGLVAELNCSCERSVSPFSAIESVESAASVQPV